MEQILDWQWVENQAARTAEVWQGSASRLHAIGQQFSQREQQDRERAYDEALETVEREAARTTPTKEEQSEAQRRMVESFARFSATALDLEPENINLLTAEFLPVGTQLASWARRFDAGLSMPDIIQACRNAWTACGLQPLLGAPLELTPSILGYSLLYPYSDNFLDQEDVTPETKLQFSRRFRQLLQGEDLSPANRREIAVKTLINLIESQYPRTQFPQVFECLLAIHQAQEQSIHQVTRPSSCETADILRISCAKGGSSVLADACLAYGKLTNQESRFAFEWGVLLQLGDDLQDVREDMHRGSVTLFSREAGFGKPLDSLAIQLLNFSQEVAARMDQLPHGAPHFKNLLKMSWRSLIIRAAAESHEFFTDGFLKEAERCSPFRFGFLRERQQRLAGQQGLYSALFEAFLQDAAYDDKLPSMLSYLGADADALRLAAPQTL